MAGNPNQKLKLLYIADYLKNYTDDQHVVTANDIVEYLKGFDISAERKSIYTDIKILQEYGLAVKKCSAPMRGYCVDKGTFKLPELMMLIDIVQASPVISPKKSRELIDKLMGLASRHQAKKMSSRLYSSERLNKSSNDDIYKSIECINKAISSSRKIRFIYRHRKLVGSIPVFDTGREFVVSPYATVWHEDRYYLVGNYDKYDDLSHYRIDKMHRVEVSDEPIRSFREVTDYTDRFDVADYSRKVFNMYAGSAQEPIELICENKLLEAVIEKFGINVAYKQYDSEHFQVKIYAVVSEGLINWILNFGGGAVVRAPQELRLKLKNRIDAMRSQYDD